MARWPLMREVDSLRLRVLGALATGVALAGGCADRAVTDDPDSGTDSSDDDGTRPDTDGTRPGTASASGNGSASSPGTTATADSGTDDVKYDVPMDDVSDRPDPTGPGPDVPPEECEDPGGENFVCDDVPSWPDSTLIYRCSPIPAGGVCDEFDAIEDANECVGAVACAAEFIDAPCGRDPSVEDACCYQLLYVEGQLCPGRPFTVAGEARLGVARSAVGWTKDMHVELAGLTPMQRNALADAWATCGLYEHASVASFSRFTLELLSVGAPATLVEHATRATAQELDHARACFGLASAYAGHPVGPGPLPVDGALADHRNLATVAAAAVREGCIAESISALQVAVAARRTHDASLSRELQRIADEELQHAELAWAFVAWALHVGDASVQAAVFDAFNNPATMIPRGPELDPRVDPAVYTAHGLLTERDRIALAHRAIDHIITPAAHQLRASPTARPSTARA